MRAMWQNIQSVIRYAGVLGAFEAYAWLTEVYIQTQIRTRHFI